MSEPTADRERLTIGSQPGTFAASVVVASKDRPALLSRCLQALLTQDFPYGPWEILVVDDSATGSAEPVVRRFAAATQALPASALARGAASPPVLDRGESTVTRPLNGSKQRCAAAIRYLSMGTVGRQAADSQAEGEAELATEALGPPGRRNEQAHMVFANDRSRPAIRTRPRGPAAARNTGWRAARAEIIGFTDDDCLPSPTWLASGFAAFVDGVAGVSGRLIVPLPASPTDYELNAGALAHSEFVTANCFYRRSALEAAGGFDERFQAAWREDSDLHFTLLEQGRRLSKEPRAVVTHPLRPAPWGVSLGQQKKAEYNALLYKKHPSLYRSRIQPSPRFYYPVTLAFGATVLFELAGRRRFAAATGAVWAGSTLAFAARRLHRTSRAPSHVAEMLVTSAVIPPLALYWRLRGAAKYRTVFW